MVRRAIRFLVLPFLVGATGVHPMHTTLTQIAQSGSPAIVSVTIRGFEDDLAVAARGRSRGPVDSAIASYLRQKITLIDGSGRRVSLSLREIRRSRDVLWLSFRSERPVNLAGGSFHNSALTERFQDQVNLVQISIRGQTRTILFTAGDGPKALDE
jgi:hypothetical protein